MATIDDFKKLDLRIGKILTAEKVEGSEKLMKLSVDFSEEKRQIVAGIAKKYSSEDLVNKQFVFAYNLEPRQLMGLESNGMILAVSDEEKGPILLAPTEETLSGNKVS